MRLWLRLLQVCIDTQLETFSCCQVFTIKLPQFKFVRRKNIVLSIDADKTTEDDLFRAITKAMQILEANSLILQDYTTYNDLSSQPGHYVLFWELHAVKNADLDKLDTAIMENCCARVEQSLDEFYKELRNQGNVISPLEIRAVKHGTFDALMDFYLSQGSSAAQYKTPKSIKSQKALQLLNSMVVGCYSNDNKV